MSRLKGIVARRWASRYARDQVAMIQREWMHLQPHNIVPLLEGIDLDILRKTGKHFSEISG